MNSLTRLCGMAASVLIFTIFSTAEAWAQPASGNADSDTALPTTITLQVPSRSDASGTTITVEVRPIGAMQATEVRILSDADPGSPALIEASIGNATVETVPVDTQHAFDWTKLAQPAAVGCGPHPPVGTPGCGGTGQVQLADEPAVPATRADTEVAGVQAAPPPASAPIPMQLPPGQVGTTAEDSAAPSPARVAAQVPAREAQSAAASVQSSMPPLVYTVQPGDTLSGIAGRFYGDSAAYARIAQANLGRLMADGRVLDNSSLIRPGWQLVIPDPARAIADRDGHRFYTVQPGDTLSGIAARLLGDAHRWPEVYTLNQQTAQLGGPAEPGSSPGLITSGAQLRLPASASGGALAASSPHAPVEGDHQ